MNKSITVLVVVLFALVGGFFLFNNYIYQEKQADEVVTEAPERDVYLKQFEDRAVQLAFDYPEGPDGYVLDDVTQLVDEETQGVEVVQAYRIMNMKEKQELESSEIGREGPPVMLVVVYENDLKRSASMWVDAFPMLSNIGMVLSEVDRDAVVGGANAVRYRADGLYVSDNVVVASGDYIYHFTGAYLEPDSVIHQDFKALVDSVRFITSAGADGGVGAKIDVQVACESALAYMLFETGEQADQFVAECVAGEHPEVIERYINDTGPEGAAI